MDNRATAIMLLTVSAGFGMPDIPPMVPENRPPWAPKQWGRRFSGGMGTKLSQRTSPRYRKTRHGCMKKGKRR